MAINVGDTLDDVQYVVRKLLNIRMFPNVETEKRWDKSVKDLGLEILCVSQVSVIPTSNIDRKKANTNLFNLDSPPRTV